MASGQTSVKPDKHVCKPPAGQPVGWLWYCPDCWSGFEPGTFASVKDRRRAAVRTLASIGGNR